MVFSIDVPDAVVAEVQEGLRTNRIGLTREDGDIVAFLKDAIMSVYFERILESEYSAVMKANFPEWQT